MRHNPATKDTPRADEFDSAGFADLCHDAAWFLSLSIIALTIIYGLLP